jgi:hypothetical protein
MKKRESNESLLIISSGWAVASVAGAVNNP